MIINGMSEIAYNVFTEGLNAAYSSYINNLTKLLETHNITFLDKEIDMCGVEVYVNGIYAIDNTIKFKITFFDYANGEDVNEDWDICGLPIEDINMIFKYMKITEK